MRYTAINNTKRVDHDNDTVNTILMLDLQVHSQHLPAFDQQEYLLSKVPEANKSRDTVGVLLHTYLPFWCSLPH
jgi:hypothetical protein